MDKIRTLEEILVDDAPVLFGNDHAGLNLRRTIERSVRLKWLLGERTYCKVQL